MPRSSFSVRYVVTPDRDASLDSDPAHLRGAVKAHLQADPPPAWLDPLAELDSGAVSVRLVVPDRAEVAPEFHAAIPLGPAEPRLIVSTPGRHGPARPGVWAARFVARALAERVGGTVLDPDAAALGPLPGEPIPDAEGPKIAAYEHLRVPTSTGPDRRAWLSVAGLANFGLPNLSLPSVPPPMTEHAARLLIGVAQHLIEREHPTLWSPGTRTRFEIRLALPELQRALRIAPVAVPGAKGWTRVGLICDGTFGARRGRTLTVCPPVGAPDPVSRWLRAALRELIGATPGQPHPTRARSEDPVQRRSSARR